MNNPSHTPDPSSTRGGGERPAPRPPDGPPAPDAEIRRLRAALEASRDAILFLDGTTGRVIDANAAACEALGYSPDEILSLTADQIAPRAMPFVRAALDAAAQGKPEGAALQLELHAKSGVEMTVQWRMRAVPETSPPVVAVVARPLAVLAQGTRSGARPSPSDPRGGYDALTGLPDRRRFESRLDLALADARRDPGRRFAVLFLDLDGFKSVNDRFGHLSGDGLLAEIADRIARSVRPDDLIARFGGDEFTIFLDDLHSEADALAAARRICAGVAAPVDVEGQAVTIEASVGIAVSWRGYEHPEAMLRDADRAMFAAKQSPCDKCRVAGEP